MNKLPQNSPPLMVHCASKNDDLGNHTLTFNQEFSWKFCENFFWNTLLHSEATWGKKTRRRLRRLLLIV